MFYSIARERDCPCGRQIAPRANFRDPPRPGYRALSRVADANEFARRRPRGHRREVGPISDHPLKCSSPLFDHPGVDWMTGIQRETIGATTSVVTVPLAELFPAFVAMRA